jgi:hypothetical protein
MTWQEVNDPELIQRLERRRRSQAEEFLKTADKGKWYRIPWSRATIKRVAKRLGLSVEVKAREDGVYCRIL